MNVENNKSQMRKGMLEYCIMLLIHRQPCYANDIITQLQEAEMIVVEGTLYPLLTRLKNSKLLKYEWRESTQGPPRKYYALTLDGEEALRQLDDSWRQLTRTVAILKTGRSAMEAEI
jgi:PadR family transcriptional regulator PadR